MVEFARIFMVSKVSKKTKQMLFSLRFSILSIFISLFVLTTFIIIYLSSIAFSDELKYTSLSLMKHVSELVTQELISGLSPIERAGRLSARLIGTNVIAQDEEELVPYTYALVKTVPLVRAAYWGGDNGNFIYSKKESDGTILSEMLLKHENVVEHVAFRRDLNGNIIKREILPVVEYDPRTRPWYIAATNQGKTSWTDIYKYAPTTQTVVSTGTPVFNKEDKIIGVFGLDMSVDYLTGFVTDIDISPHGFAFIITENGDLVAYPKNALIKHMPTLMQNNNIVNIKKYPQSLIYQSVEAYKKNKLSEFTMEYENENYSVTFQVVPEMEKYGWLVGVITPTSDFISFLQEVDWIAFIVSLMTLLLGILIVSGLITRIVKPIKELVKETVKIRNFELEGEMKIHSRIKEVIFLQNSINSMKLGLKQFQRYVPKILVRQLIESGQDVYAGGVRKNLVVMFTDIENFTTIAEHMDPGELMTDICSYFEIISQVILSEQGTIDKYIGDSMMAFWGAPIQEDNPCERAANAALQCQKLIGDFNAHRVAQGKPVFNTRIGIHAGEAIVGNVGSSERLSYTALGDTINIASRLEKINKDYHTGILVSEDVYNKLKDKFVMRLVDRVIVKGHSKELNIYELLRAI